MHRALHIASFFTRQGAPTSGETTAATVVDIDPRETAAHEEAAEEEQLSELLEPAAQPVTSRKGKRRAPAEEDRQLEPSRARKGNSDGQWRGQEKYGLTPNMMALYEWASVVEGHPEFVERVTCTMVKNQPVRLRARPQTLEQHAETKGFRV